MNNYQLTLTIASPSPLVPADLLTRKPDITQAISEYNIKFMGRKRISIINISQSITIELISEQPIMNPTRALNSFSQILKNKYGWGDFSGAQNRVFDVKLDKTSGIAALQQGTSTQPSQSLFASISTALLSMEDKDELDYYIQQLSQLSRLAEAKRVISQYSLEDEND